MNRHILPSGPTRDMNRTTSRALKRAVWPGQGKDRGEVVRVWWAENGGVWERSRVPGCKACCGGLRSRDNGGKLGQKSGGLRLMSARRGQSWCPDKGSVHKRTWPGGEPNPTIA
jgi:hypothetical protein